jgi:hypothetical protein
MWTAHTSILIDQIWILSCYSVYYALCGVVYVNRIARADDPVLLYDEPPKYVTLSKHM